MITLIDEQVIAIDHQSQRNENRKTKSKKKSKQSEPLGNRENNTKMKMKSSSPMTDYVNLITITIQITIRNQTVLLDKVKNIHLSFLYLGFLSTW